MASIDEDGARLAWSQLDQETHAEIIAAIREHGDVLSPGLHARLMSMGLRARGYGGPEAQSFLVPVALKKYIEKIGGV